MNPVDSKIKGEVPRFLAARAFDHLDQTAFATFSHDWNPMHVDPVQARRFISGAQVVHGINLLLTGIDAAADGHIDVASIIRISCEFKVAVNIGEKLVFSLAANDADRAVIIAKLGEVVCTTITLYFDKLPLVAPSTPSHALPDGADTTEIVFLESPQNPSEADYRSLSGEIRLAEGGDIARMYPHLTSAKGIFLCRALSGLSYIVGMMCPGLHSIFYSLNVNVPADFSHQHSLKFRADKFEDRIKLLDLALESGFLTGSVKAFRRPVPVEQPDMSQIEPAVGKAEFEGIGSFVIGGSRGLGELTSKIICAGGGKVLLGYAVGEADASRVRDDIEISRPGSCRITQFDIRKEIDSELGALLANIDSVFYFPTPVISKKINAVFNQEVFENFLTYYVFAFYRLCDQLERNAVREIKIYYPSTVFLDERPNGMTEYAMAKAAAEQMISDMNRTYRFVKIHLSRLPRLKSDQTNSILQTKTGENLSYLLEIAREMHRAAPENQSKSR